MEHIRMQTVCLKVSRFTNSPREIYKQKHHNTEAMTEMLLAKIKIYKDVACTISTYFAACYELPMETLYVITTTGAQKVTAKIRHPN